MKKSKLNIPHIKMLIAHRVARGHSQRMIAEELRTSQPAISRIIRQDDVQDLIREEVSILVKQVSDILVQVRNDPKVIDAYKRWIEKELLNFRWV